MESRERVKASNPYVGYGDGCEFLEGMIEKLHRDGYFVLDQITPIELTTI